MFKGIKPTQYVKEHFSDSLFKVANNYYVNSFYGGIVQVDETEYERLKAEGRKER